MPHATFRASVTLGALVLLAGCIVSCGSPSSSAPGGATTTPAPAGTSPFPVIHPRIVGSTDKGDAITALAARDTTVWIDVDDNLLVSIDKGAHWSWRAMLPADVTSLAFGSSQDGWAASPDGLIHTIDGGASWQPIAPVRDAVTRVRLVDATHGWITTKSGGLQSTSDGGATWTTVTDPCTLDGNNVGGGPLFSFYDAENGWAVCLGEPTGGFQAKDLFSTHDGGMHWGRTSYVHWGSDPTPSPLPLPSGYGSDLFVLDAQHAWISQERGDLMETDDGAHTWRDVGPTELESVAFVSTTEGYALGGGGVISVGGNSAHGTIYALPDAEIFSDFAARLTAVPGLPSGYNPSSSLTIANDRWVIAERCVPATLEPALATKLAGNIPNPRKVCATSVLLHSDNAGNSWEQIDLPDRLFGWLFASSGHVRVVGDRVTLETSDGGRTWTRIWPALVHHN
ncbi:MAG TPA: hypothetical protein VFY79_10415 [Dehalococcoidia bacterium]|nr:hypothetical protein [Dehalococcoidia bacterium]